MFSFSAYRWGNLLFSDEHHRFLCGEILTDYLNFDIEKFENLYHELRKINVQIGGVDSGKYDERVHRVQQIMSYFDHTLASLKPFVGTPRPATQRLYDLLSHYPTLFVQQHANADFALHDDSRFEELIDGEESWERKHRSYDKISDEIFLFPEPQQLDSFRPNYKRIDQGYFRYELDELSRQIPPLMNSYIEFGEDVLRVKYVLSDFLDNYFPTGASFPNPHQAAEAYRQLLRDIDQKLKDSVENTRHRRFKEAARHQVDRAVIEMRMEDGSSQPVLCEYIRYEDIGSLLLDELFIGINSGQLPRRCGCCGKYFLLENGHYASFCDGIAPDSGGKSCQEVGSRRKYALKVKNDPIWLAYQRAYKAHYARYMKKKMTTAQFEQWSREAMAKRDAMLSGESGMSSEEYAAWLKI